MTELSKILTISGKPGLYMTVASAKSGIVVESLIDGKRTTAFAHERISSLAEISVFTTGEDMPLKDILKKIREKYESKPVGTDLSNGAQLRAFMEEIVPDYDADRVYTSDIKKIISWYNLLAEKEMLDFKEETPEENEQAEEKSEQAEASSEENAEAGKE